MSETQNFSGGTVSGSVQVLKLFLYLVIFRAKQ